MSRSEQAARVLDMPPLRALARRAPLWRGVLVLNYHRIDDGSRSVLDRGVLSATPEALDAQLRFLRQHVEVVRLEDVEDARARRGRHVLLTFDDGYRDNFELAFPLLRAHGLPTPLP